MRVIICGAGRVGLSIASYLSFQDNHVTIIDKDVNLIRRITDTYDINGIVGHASQPDILKKAGCDNADIILAVTDSDEVNMVACQIAHSVFGVSKKIARIRQREYRDPAWSNLFSRNHMPIDVIISPEEEIAAAILSRMSVPGTTNDITVADNNIHIFGIICSEENPLAGNSIKTIDYTLRNVEFRILVVFRSGETIIPNDDYIARSGDEIYFLTKRSALFDLLGQLGISRKSTGNTVICGGGVIGQFLTEKIYEENNYLKRNVIVIEKNIDRARIFNRMVEQALVLNGSALDKDILEEAGVPGSSVFVGVMDSNENNILAAVLAKKMGARYSIALNTNKLYNQLLPDKIVDAIVNPETITVSRILHYLRKGRILSVNTLRDARAELIEAEVSENCSIVNVPISEISLPKDVVIGGIYRPSTGEVIYPKKDTVILSGDIAIVLSATKDIKQVEKLFSFSIDLF